MQEWYGVSPDRLLLSVWDRHLGRQLERDRPIIGAETRSEVTARMTSRNFVLPPVYTSAMTRAPGTLIERRGAGHPRPARVCPGSGGLPAAKWGSVRAAKRAGSPGQDAPGDKGLRDRPGV